MRRGDEDHPAHKGQRADDEGALDEVRVGSVKSSSSMGRRLMVSQMRVPESTLSS